MAEDPFDDLLELEEKFYEEGQRLGVEDGRRAGLIEGRFFGLEKGFEKYAAMGKLHGRSVVWAGRLPLSKTVSHGKVLSEEVPNAKRHDQASMLLQAELVPNVEEEASPGKIQSKGSLAALPVNPRLEKHVRTLFALVEPSSLSTANNENSVTDFADRFKRAEGKVRIIEKLVGEEKNNEVISGAISSGTGKGTSQNRKVGDGGIEDMSVLQARH